MLFVVLGLAVAGIVLATARLKVHPFLALIGAALFTGIATGMPLASVAQSMNDGFGTMMRNIGLVIVAGTLIGVILEKSGAALRMAEVVLRRVGPSRPQLAMSITGAIASVPVFCDSGFVILSSLNKALAQRARVPLASMSVALATGLYATHTLVPPTPGPIAVADNLGASDHLGVIIIVGLIVAVPTILVGYLWAMRVAIRVTTPSDTEPFDPTIVTRHFGAMPSTTAAFLPLLVPLALISLRSLAAVFAYEGPGGALIEFAGSPMIALFIGLGCASWLLPRWDEETLTGWMGEGIRTAAPILLITGAGGAFGTVLSATPIATMIGGLVERGLPGGALVLVLPFLIAAALKTAQGSSTAAMVITSALVAPVLVGMGIESPFQLALVVMSIGAGAMTVSHANDSYFWVVTQFSGITVKDAYKAYTLATLVQGLTAFATALLLYALLVGGAAP